MTSPRVGTTVAIALLMGLSIQLIGTIPWMVLMKLNVRHSPEVPWAALTMASWLVVMCVWLGGRGWPRGTAAFRRLHMRTWRPEPGAWSGDNRATILGLMGAMVGLSVVWVLVGMTQSPVDVSVYPTTSVRFSILLMGPLVAGVVEEVAFRGYMQSHLERIGPTFAIVVTSIAFTVIHASHGLAYLLTVAPGFFLVSVIYGHLAQKSGSILPGMFLHFAGDLAYSYFVLLGGNTALLFAR